LSLRGLAEIRRAPPLAEQIYLRLRKLIRSGNLAPAERLVDAALAQSLKVSRTPVREALTRLAADGLIETRGGGFQVVTPTTADMDEIFEMRRLLEPPAVRQAAALAAAAALAQLDEALEEARRAERAEDVTAFMAANYAFRAAWIAQVPSSRLREAILRMDDQAGLVRSRTLVLPAARAEALGLLEAMMPAFRARDGAAVAALTRQFIDAAARFFRLAAATETETDVGTPDTQADRVAARPRRTTSHATGRTTGSRP
jgi:DNA-binding GntR family transcriptional regulator